MGHARIRGTRSDDGQGKLPWTHWKTTKRYPADRSADATSQNTAIAWQLDQNLVNLRQRTYQMLAMQKDYHNISNNMVASTLMNGGVLDSLESVHDTIHNTVGNGGHLTNVAYSAFDPCFWLLHT
jgi:tyrosinase